MAKTYVQDALASSQDNILKKRKKLAKKEARLMLKVEQAKKDVQKAEQKIQKARDNLKIRTERLHDLEGELSQLQGSISAKSGQNGKNNKPNKKIKADKKNKVGKSSKDSGSGQINQPATNDFRVIDSGDSYQDNADVEAFHLSSLDPAEGSNRILDADMATSNQPEQPNDYLSPAHHTPSVSEEDQNSQVGKAESSTSPSTGEITIQSGEGSMPVETRNEHAWPPPLIREEVAEAIEEETRHKPTVVEKHTHPTAESSLEGASNKGRSGARSGASPRRPATRRRHTHTSSSHQSEEKNQEPSQEKDQDTQSNS